MQQSNQKQNQNQQQSSYQNVRKNIIKIKEYPATLRKFNNSILSIKYIYSILIYLSYLFPLSLQAGDFTYITVDNPITSVTTNYMFEIYQLSDIPIPAGSYLEIMFPNQYIDVLQSKSYNCFISLWPSSYISPTISCTISNLKLTVNDIFTNGIPYTSDLPTYIFVVQGINNPLQATQTDPLILKFISFEGNVIISMQTDLGSGVMIGEGQMNCQMTASPAMINYQQSSMIFQLLPTKIFPSDLTLTINIHKNWPRDTVNSSSTQIFSTYTPTCQSLSSNVQTNLVCSTVALSDFYIITVTNILESLTSDPIKFSISTIRNPPSIQQQGDVNISSFRANSNGLQKCENIKMTGIISGEINQASFTMENKQVFSESIGYLQFTVHSLIDIGDLFYIQFPQTFSLSKLIQIHLININYKLYNPSIVNNSITLNITNKITANSKVSVQFNNVINPTNQKITDSFIINTLRKGYLMQELKGSGLKYNAKRGIINFISSSLTSSQIGLLSNYSITISLVHTSQLTSQSAIILQIPKSYQQRITSCKPSCIISSQNYAQIKFHSFYTQLVNTNQLTIQLVNVTNPLTLGSTSSFKAYTLQKQTDKTSVIDQISSGISFFLTARQLIQTDITLTTDSLIVFNYPTTYSFRISNKNDLPKYTYLKINLPKSILGSEQVSCIYNSLSLSCNYDQLNNTITVSYFSSNIILSGVLSNSQLKIQNLYNPTSTKATSTFQFQLLNADDQVIEYLRNGFTYQVTQPTTFNTLSITLNSSKNSALNTSLRVSFTVPIPFYENSSLLLITFPSQINIQTVSCTFSSSNLISVTCSKSSNLLKVILVYSNIQSNIETIFNVNNFKNYPSLKPFGFGLDLYTNSLMQNKICISISGETQNLQINNQLGGIVLQKYTFSNQVLNQEANLQIIIDSLDYLGFQYIVIRFSNEFKVGSGGCTLPSGINCFVNDTLYPNSFLLNTSLSSTFTFPLIITLKNITTPTFTPSSKIYIQTYTSSSSPYLIDRNSQMIFSTLCTLPCKKCDSLNFSKCTQCYTDPSFVSNLIILDGNICKSSCSKGYYEQNSVCVICSTNCQTCQNFSQCLSCNNNKYLLNYECLSDCPPTYYSYSTRCFTCSLVLNCYTCLNSYQCESCINGYFFYNKQCSATCPSLITVQNTVTKNCDPCPTNCTQCKGDYTEIICTKCLVGYFIDNSRCALECTTAGYVKSITTCIPCSSLCLTCSIISTNCTTCDYLSSNPFYHNYKCISNCPQTYFNDISLYICQKCNSPCEICSNSSNATCNSCLTPYVQQKNPTTNLISCLSNCEPGYYSSSYVCLSCISPCEQCLNEFQCVTCISGYLLYSKKCVTQCDPGMTIINGNQCQVCLASCKTCSSANSSYCQSCYVDNYFFNGTCSVNCPSKYYENTTTFTCNACTVPCLECQSINYCLSCTNSLHVIENGQCLIQCTTPLINISSMCTSCSSECQTCQNSIKQCILCSISQTNIYYYYPVNKSCINTCDYYIIRANESQSTNIQCVQNCGNGYFIQASNNLNYCQKCSIECSICISLTNCSECKNSSYFIYENVCYLKCPSNVPYSYNGTCRKCNITNCNLCVNESYCGTCDNGYLLIVSETTNNLIISFTSKCLSQCPNPSVQTYNSSTLKCQQNNNSNSQTTRKVLSTSIPPFTFLGIFGLFLFLAMISKIQYSASSNLVILLFFLLAFCSQLAVIHLLYMQIKNLFEYMNQKESTILEQVSYNSIPLTTYLIASSQCLHLLTMMSSFFSIIYIKDYALFNTVQQNSLVSTLFILLFIFDPRIIFTLNSGLLI